jgi:hypothetical protein
MTTSQDMIELGWRLYSGKVASGLLSPENEKMMQLQFALVLQTLSPLFEFSTEESYKVLLEVPVVINGSTKRIIDIVVEHSLAESVSRIAIELKCFRLYVRNSKNKRGAQNLGMHDYWKDIANIEGCCALPEFQTGYQFTITDDRYYADATHSGPQVATYSTSRERSGVTGLLSHSIANRKGQIVLRGTYSMEGWIKDGSFYFIHQRIDADCLP